MASNEPLFVYTWNDVPQLYRVKIKIRHFDTIWMVSGIKSILYNYKII